MLTGNRLFCVVLHLADCSLDIVAVLLDQISQRSEGLLQFFRDLGVCLSVAFVLLGEVFFEAVQLFAPHLALKQFGVVIAFALEAV
jgi:hypothetical protein